MGFNHEFEASGRLQSIPFSWSLRRVSVRPLGQTLLTGDSEHPNLRPRQFPHNSISDGLHNSNN